jgi:hypothetical protein
MGSVEVSDSDVKAINRRDPGRILLLVDQSGSMNDSFAGDPTTSKAVTASDAVNKLILDIMIKLERTTDEFYRYLDLRIVGYDPSGDAGFGLHGVLYGQGLTSVNEVLHNSRGGAVMGVGGSEGGLAEFAVRFPVGSTHGHNP